MIVDAGELKAAAEAAFKQGHYEEAAALYEEILNLDPDSPPALCNHSAVALKCGQQQKALQAAERAQHLLALQAAQDPGQACLRLLAKAHHRKAKALISLGQLLPALKVYRQGLAACHGEAQAMEELLGALRIATEQLPPSWLAKYWARWVEEAEQPNPLSSRDGRMLRIIPPERRLGPQELRGALCAAFRWELGDESRDLMCGAWGRSCKPGKAEVAFMRATAYHQAGNQQQALKDVRVALVYGPQATPADALALVLASEAGAGAGTMLEVPCWPAALALQGAAHEGLGDNLAAALSFCQALELEPGHEAWEAALERLLRRIPEEQARVLQKRGSAGLEAYLAAEKEQRMPEFLRKRPKYYYYYEWMRKRINEQYPELPEPVMDKLLTMDATELDLILQYPQATQQTVERVLGVYRKHGESYLETYRVPLLSWEEVKALKGPDTVGLPLGDSAFGGLLDRPGSETPQAAALPPPSQAALEGEPTAPTCLSAGTDAPAPAIAASTPGGPQLATPSQLGAHKRVPQLYSLGRVELPDDDKRSDGSDNVDEFDDLLGLD